VGERPKAFVTLAPGARADERDVIDFCRLHLARFKAPVAVVFGPLPKTSAGKVRKNVLREREWAGRSREIN
jgi:fatty-acyl-CoA synthase